MNGTSSWSNNYIGPDTTNELDAEISDLFYDFVDEQACRHGDWVNNEGGYGTMIIYVDGTYQLDYQRTTGFTSIVVNLYIKSHGCTLVNCIICTKD